jgi:CMP-N-acetylneuraminic acid synthetase
VINIYILGIIPARGGSKGIPMKNLFPLNGMPLIQYTITEAKKSSLSDVIVTTDSDLIAVYAHKSLGNSKCIKRPPELAMDDTKMIDTIKHAVECYERHQKVDAVMILQPTSPLRSVDDIESAITHFQSKEHDSLISVCEGIHPIKSYDQELTPFCDQDIPYDKHIHKCYTRNGAIFITRRDLLDQNKLTGERPAFLNMPKVRSIDIDDYEDLTIVDALLKRGVEN